MRNRTNAAHTQPVTASAVALSDLAIWPSIVFIYLFLLLQLGGIDEYVANLFFDRARGLFPLKHDFWAERVLHDGGQRVMIGMALLAAGTWVASLRVARLRAWRRLLAYILMVVLLSVGTTNLCKEISNMDCPWDLVEFGGRRIQFGLLQDKPDDTPRGRCFPGGHSSGGFALFALFFVGRQLGCRRAWLSLTPACVIGVVFALDQWARGAHFPSHDLTTAYLCWMIALGSYAWLFRYDESPAGRRFRGALE